MSTIELSNRRTTGSSAPVPRWAWRLLAGVVTVFITASTFPGQSIASASPTALAPSSVQGDIFAANSLASTISVYGAGSSGGTQPLFTLFRGLDVPSGMAFDPAGDLWVANYADSTVVEFAAQDLGNSASVPSVTITSDSSGSLNSPVGMAFDAAGNLWVANDVSNTIVEYAKATLAAGAVSPTGVTPAVTISSGPAKILNGPYALAFDSSGDLWVGNYDNSTVVELAKDGLVHGPGTPRLTISPGPSVGLNSPGGLAFDAEGDLWVASNLSNKLLEYSAAQLALTAPGPAVTISANPYGSLNSPEGLAFDRSGNLWVANYGNDSVAEFAGSQLIGSGPVPPSLIAGPETGLRAPGSIAIAPWPGPTPSTAPALSASLTALKGQPGLARLELRCQKGPCSGLIEVVNRPPLNGARTKGARASRGTTPLGSVHYSLARGQVGRFTVHLVPKARSSLTGLASYRIDDVELVITLRGGRAITLHLATPGPRRPLRHAGVPNGLAIVSRA
jgi:sugar lactone lactonase YvrE